MERRVKVISSTRAGLELVRFGFDPAGTIDWLGRYDIVQVEGAKRLHVLNHPKDVRTVLGQEGKLEKNTYETEVLKYFIEGSMFTSAGGRDHQERRDRARPAFNPGLFDNSVRIITERTTEMLDDWARRGGGRSFVIRDVSREMGGLSARIAAKAFFDFNLSNDQSKKVESALNTVLEFIGVSLRYNKIPVHLQDLPIGYFNKFRQAKRVVMSFIDKVIEADSNPTSVIGLLKRAHQANPENFTKADIEAEIRSLMGAGIATTRNALAWTLYELGRFDGRDYVKRIRSEATGLTPRKEHPRLMPVANACFSESLRLHPPLWVLGRKVLANIDLGGGYEMEEGDSVRFFPYVLHTRSDYWSNPFRYNPERFDKSVDTSAFLPFGYGPRVCIGARFAMAEGAIVLNAVAQRYNLRTLSRVTPAFSTGMTPKGKVAIELTPV